MNWKNRGLYNPKTWDPDDSSTWKWQLDHKLPHSMFNYTSMEDQAFLDCWDLSNLEPISALENLNKRNKVDIGLLNQYLEKIQERKLKF